MNSAAQLLRCMSALPPAAAAAANGKVDGEKRCLFARAPTRTEMQRLLFQEAFLGKSMGEGTQMSETWFVRENADVVRSAWDSFCGVSDCPSSSSSSENHRQPPSFTEIEVVVHLGCFDGSGSNALPPWQRIPTVVWPHLVADLHPSVGGCGAPDCSSFLQRMTHYANNVRVTEPSDGDGVVVKELVRRHRIEVADSPLRWSCSSPESMRASIQVSRETPVEAAAAADQKPNCVRYKLVHAAATPLWVASLICEVQVALDDPDPQPMPPFPTVESHLFGADRSVLLMSMCHDGALARAVLGGEIVDSTTEWRIELEFEAGVVCPTLLDAGVISALLLSNRIKSDAVDFRHTCSWPAIPWDALSHTGSLLLEVNLARAKALCRRLCKADPMDLFRRNRPHELTVANIGSTVNMAVSPKDDGVELVVVVHVRGVVFFGPCGTPARALQVDVPAGLRPAVLSAELVGDAVAIVNDCWVLPPAFLSASASQWNNLLVRCAAYSRYVQAVSDLLPRDARPRLCAKQWHYTFDSDIRDLLDATEAAWSGETPADGLLFCSLHGSPGCHGAKDERRMLKLKPRVTVDLLVSSSSSTQRLCARGAGGGGGAPPGALEPLAPPWSVAPPGTPAQFQGVAEFSIAADSLAFVRARPDKNNVPNLMRGVQESLQLLRAFPQPFSEVLWLRNGARTFRHAGNRLKRTVLQTHSAGAEVIVDLGVGSDVNKYAAHAALRVLVGVDLDPEKLQDARTRYAAIHPRPRWRLDLLVGDFNLVDIQNVIKLRVRCEAPERVAVVCNWAAGYIRDLSQFAFFVADVLRCAPLGGRFLGVFHDWSILRGMTAATATATAAVDPLPTTPDGHVDPLCSVAVFAQDARCGRARSYVGSVPAASRALVYSRVSPFLAVGMSPASDWTRDACHWLLLCPDSPSFSNVERPIAWVPMARACVDAGMDCAAPVPSSLPFFAPPACRTPTVLDSATPFCFSMHRFRPRRARHGADCYDRTPTALPACVEPVVVPAFARRIVAFEGPEDTVLRGFEVSDETGMGEEEEEEGEEEKEDRGSAAAAAVLVYDVVGEQPFVERHARLRSLVPEFAVVPYFHFDDEAGLTAFCVGHKTTVVGVLYVAANHGASVPLVHAAWDADAPHWQVPLAGTPEELAELRVVRAVDRALVSVAATPAVASNHGRTVGSVAITCRQEEFGAVMRCCKAVLAPPFVRFVPTHRNDDLVCIASLYWRVDVDPRRPSGPPDSRGDCHRCCHPHVPRPTTTTTTTNTRTARMYPLLPGVRRHIADRNVERVGTSTGTLSEAMRRGGVDPNLWAGDVAVLSFRDAHGCGREADVRWLVCGAPREISAVVMCISDGLPSEGLWFEGLLPGLFWTQWLPTALVPATTTCT